MSIAVLDEQIPTIADVIASLGDVPANRVLMRPFPGTATESDVLRLIAADRICELIDGTLVEKAMGGRESILTLWLAHKLAEFLDRFDLGFLCGPDGTLRMFGGNIRFPDISFVSWNQLPDHQVPDGPIFNVSPLLAIEVLSASNTRREMLLKREDYFASGTQVVWEIDPLPRTIRVYTNVEESTLLTVADQLDGGTVLPGFSISVRAIFAKLDRRG